LFVGASSLLPIRNRRIFKRQIILEWQTDKKIRCVNIVREQNRGGKSLKKPAVLTSISLPRNGVGERRKEHDLAVPDKRRGRQALGRQPPSCACAKAFVHLSRGNAVQ
jgi:hypothetical protein